MKVDMGTDNVITIRGSPIFVDEIGNGTNNEWYKTILEMDNESKPFSTMAIFSICLAFIIVIRNDSHLNEAEFERLL